MEALWIELQIELSLYHAHLIVERSGHRIRLDQPELIGDTVRLALRRVNQPSSPAWQRRVAMTRSDSRPNFGTATWVSNSRKLTLVTNAF